MKMVSRIVPVLLAAAMVTGGAGAAAAAVKGPGKFLPWNLKTSAGGEASWQEAYPNGLSEEADVLSYLKGTWCFLNNGDIYGLQDRPEKSISFFPEERKVLFTKDHGDQYVEAGLALDRLNTGSGQFGTLIRVTPKEVSEGFSASGMSFTGYDVDFQVVTANVMGEEILALREIGNGDSELGYQGLGYDWQSSDDFWIFERMDYAREAEDFRPTAEQNAAMRLYGKTFYAFSWYQYEGSCFLQEMDAKEEELEWYMDRLPMISYQYPANGHAMTAVRYEFSEELQKARTGEGMLPDVRAFMPQFVRVTTNEKGEITELENMVYLSLGLYLSPETAKQYFGETLGGGAAESAAEAETAGNTDSAAALLKVDYAENGLAAYSACDEFTADAGDPAVKAMFTAEKTLKNLKFHKLYMKDVSNEGKVTWLTDEIYRQEEITPERPLVVTLVFYGDTPGYAVSYTAEDGTEQYFGLDMSGMDGSLYLFPL
ncbi:MAG: hypothetical protein IJT43_05080 [Stomatobaculum sp.]|nr:hypothetical protein [Stomatobaculum sp.]